MSARRQSPSSIPALVVLLGLAASIFTWSRTAEAERQAEEARLAQLAWQLSQRLGAEVQRETEALSLLQLAAPVAPGSEHLAADDALDRALTDDRGDRALRFVAWLLPLRLAEVDAWERDARRADDGGPSVRVRPAPSAPAAPREGDDVPGPGPLWVVDRVFPQDREAGLRGVDLATDPAWRQTIDDAVANARLGVSSPPHPLADVDGGEAVFVAMPAYTSIAPPPDPASRAAAVRGVVVGELALQPLLESALAPSGDPHETHVSATVLDHGSLVGHVGPAGLEDSLHGQSSVRVGGRAWTLELRPAGDPPARLLDRLDRTSVVLPPAVLVVMCLVSWIVWKQQRQTLVVRVRVARQTAVLRRQNAALGAKEHELQLANQRLREISNTDPLTGILNRRAFELQLDRERDRSRRSGVPYGLLVFDVDDFKAFNDRYGHAAGDEVLRRVAQLINSEARRIDCVARYGGEEFVILAAGVDAAGLVALGDRVRDHVERAGIVNDAAPHGVVTVSGGGTLSSLAGDDPRAVFEVADRCLYQAKATGRNRVVVAT